MAASLAIDQTTINFPLIPPVKNFDRWYEIFSLRAAAPPTPRADTTGQEN